MIHARGVSLSYGRVKALEGVDFTAKAGEFTAIVGPNGSGKTTLLKALSGDKGFTGQIEFEDRPLGTIPLPELARRRAVLAQATAVSFPFLVGELVAMGQEAGKHAARLGLIAAALARVGMSGSEARAFNELSGGQQQRVLLARALAQVWHPVDDEGPAWLLLDEPVSALDIASQLMVLDVARDFAAAGGGVIAIMHDLNLTAMYAHQVMLMKSGEVLRAGLPADVLSDDLLAKVYGVRLRACHAPKGCLWFLPQSAQSA